MGDGLLEMEVVHLALAGYIAWSVWVTRGLFKISELVTKVELLEAKAELIEEIRKVSGG